MSIIEFLLALIMLVASSLSGTSNVTIENTTHAPIVASEVLRSTLVEKYIQEERHYLRLYNGEQILVEGELIVVWETLQPGNLVKVEYSSPNDAGAFLATSLERIIITPPHIECGNLAYSTCSQK